MSTPSKPTSSVNQPGGEGGTPGFIEIEATESLTETVTETEEINQPGGEGGTPGE
jgi:hypothetical protein